MKLILFHYILLTKNIPIRIYNINVQCTHHNVYFYFHTHTHLIHNNVHFLVSSFELHKMYFAYHTNSNKNSIFVFHFNLNNEYFSSSIFTSTRMSIFVCLFQCNKIGNFVIFSMQNTKIIILQYKQNDNFVC